MVFSWSSFDQSWYSNSLMVSIFDKSLSQALFFFLSYMSSMDKLVYFYHLLYHVLIARHIFSLSVLKTQILANLIYLFGPRRPQTLSEIKSIFLPEQELFILFFFSPLLFISVNGNKVLQDIYNWILGYPPWPFLTQYSCSFTISWQFYRLKSSWVFSLYFSHQCLISSSSVHKEIFL